MCLSWCFLTQQPHKKGSKGILLGRNLEFPQVVFKGKSVTAGGRTGLRTDSEQESLRKVLQSCMRCEKEMINKTKEEITEL